MRTFLSEIYTDTIIDERLHVKIYDAGLNVFQVQEQILPRPKNDNAASSGAALQFDLVEKPFSFTVTRKENNEILFDTSGAQLVFETQYVRVGAPISVYANHLLTCLAAN